MFHSSESISVDSKGRITMPKKFRDPIMAACEGRIVVTANPELKSLFIYPHHIWEEKLAQLNQFSSRNKLAGIMQRIFSGYSVPMQLDPSNGRISLSQTQRKYAGIKEGEQVIVMGVDERFEIWDEAGWEAYMQQNISTEDYKEAEELVAFSF